MEALIAKPIEDYAIKHSLSPSPLLRELEEYTRTHYQNADMLTGTLEGGLLRLLTQLTQAKRILEIGLFTGYSALTMAEALGPDGEIISCEINPDTAAIAQLFFDRSPHGKKIKIRLGMALETLEGLRKEAQPFDLVFLDADKENYITYYNLVRPLLKRGGLIVADNVLWSGRVLAPARASDLALAAFNEHIQNDAAVENVLLTVRDGVMLIRKK